MRKAVAIDFDGCLCANAYPAIGEPNWPVINRAKAEQRAGAGLILWTCREDQLLLDAISACEGWGLTFDAVNESLPDWIEELKTRPRKVGASEYWDDKAVQLPVVPVDPLPPMQRLTSREPRISGSPGVSCAHFRGKDCETVQGCCSDGCPWEEAAWERLAAYEDTGLEPDEIVSVQREPWCVFYTNRHCNLDGDFCQGKTECQKKLLPEDAACLLKPAQAEKNLPLTPEELREMDGEPVWIEYIPSPGEECAGLWALVSIDKEYDEIFLLNSIGGSSSYEEVRADIRAIYRRRPEEVQHNG